MKMLKYLLLLIGGACLAAAGVFWYMYQISLPPPGEVVPLPPAFQAEPEATTGTTTTTVTTTTVVLGAQGDIAPQKSAAEEARGFADPVKFTSPALGVYDARVSRDTMPDPNGMLSPLEGEVLWHQTADLTGPCEPGLVRMLTHMNPGNPGYNLIDDPKKDRHGKKDHGVKLGDEFDFVLADGTVCVYSVIEPLGLDAGSEYIKKVPDQPAIYFLKYKQVATEVIYLLLPEVGSRSIVSLWTSYGGPNADKYLDAAGIHRAYNAVVFAELVSVEKGPLGLRSGN